MALPRFVVLKSHFTNKYVRHVTEESDNRGFLECTGEKILNPCVKFELEKAKCGDGLVHIRSCYNNKYWVRWTDHHHWIQAAANEPEEDKSKWSCTLFKPVYIDGDAKTLGFVHVQLGHYLSPRWGKSESKCIFAGSADNYSKLDYFSVIDWDSLSILPKYVAFKGDNGKYLSAREAGGYQYLKFAGDNISDPTVGHEVLTTQEGSIRLKSYHLSHFWRRGESNWILVDTDDSTNNNLDTLFSPIKVGNAVVALRNLGNKKFCTRHSANDWVEDLNAAADTITRVARLQVEELLISRAIYNVDFHVTEARIHGKKDITLTTGFAINNSQEPRNQELKLSYVESRSSTWNSSVSWKLRVKTKIESDIPFFGKDEVEISGVFSGAYDWGEIMKTPKDMQAVYNVTVPPMTMVTVSMLATIGSCDIPFSYFQRDTLIDGTQVTHEYDDGMYTSVNCFDIKFKTKQENL